jgi:hypothetical protein
MIDRGTYYLYPAIAHPVPMELLDGLSYKSARGLNGGKYSTGSLGGISVPGNDESIVLPTTTQPSSMRRST